MLSVTSNLCTQGFVYSGRGDYPAEDLDDLEEDLEDMDLDDTQNCPSENEWDQDQEEIEISARRRHRFTDNRSAFVLEVRCVVMLLLTVPLLTVPLLLLLLLLLLLGGWCFCC